MGAAQLLLAGQWSRQQFCPWHIAHSGKDRADTIRPLRVPESRVVLQAVIMMENQGFHGIRPVRRQHPGYWRNMRVSIRLRVRA